jgi:hypothetical protein
MKSDMGTFTIGSCSSSAARYRQSAKDRRHAAIHEAGHVVMARHLEVHITRVEIHKVEPEDSTEKEWIGSFQFLTEGVDANKVSLVAVAGIVAEACWTRETFEDLCDDLEWDPAQMSQSDWDLSGFCADEPSEEFRDALEQSFRLLNRETGKLWGALLKEARRLIVRNRREAGLSVHLADGVSNGLVR